MRRQVRHGWLRPVQRRWSPNCDERPDNAPIDLLVVHGISLPPGQFGGPWIDQLFTNGLDLDADPYFPQLSGLRVSAHVLIHRDGAIFQYVPFHLRAWHAGESAFQGRLRCNDFSIGVELEGADDIPYTKAQYQAMAQVAQALMAAYPGIIPERIVGHCDIAPHRKTDPGPAFEWSRLWAQLAET